MTQTVKAYAKINLHLDVTGIRDDGYHSVETVMQTVSLCDSVKVSLTDSGEIECRCNIDGLPTDERNIAVRAARLFFDSAGRSEGALVEIEKSIPMAAGLAGGSADAAATLKALNLLCGEVMSIEQLCDLGARLGADVPFCIVCGSAYTDGRGDVIHEFSGLPEDTVLLVACGGEGVSTPWAYGLMDRVHNRFEGYEPKGTEELKLALETGSSGEFVKHLFNIFETPVIDRRPVAAQIKSTMLSCGALGAMMSGSGPSVFGVFEGRESAERAESEITALGYFAAICHPNYEKY